MTAIWSLAQEAYCPVGERSLKSKSMCLVTEKQITLGQQRGSGRDFSEEDLEHKMEYYRKRQGKDIPKRGSSMFRVWKGGHWFQKLSEVVAMVAGKGGGPVTDHVCAVCLLI